MVAGATGSSAGLGGVIFMLMTVDAGLAYKIANSGGPELTSGLHDAMWAGVVISSFHVRCSSCPERSGSGGQE